MVNNRNAHFRYFLGVRVRLIKVLCRVNKGNKFGDFGYCPLNKGCPRLIRCPLNTSFNVDKQQHQNKFSSRFYGAQVSKHLASNFRVLIDDKATN